jgi:hypothetical protein
MSRHEAYAKPLSLNMNLAPSHVDWLLRFSIIEPRVKDVNRLVLDPNFQEEMKDLDPKVIKSMILPWLERAARQKSEIQSGHEFFKAIDPWARMLRRRSGLAIMTGNVGNILQQVTGFSLSAVRVKPRFLRNSMFEYLKNPRQMARDVTGMSKFMNDRVTPQMAELMNEMDELMFDTNPLKKAEQFFAQHGLVGQMIFQNVVDHVTWSAAYDQSTENGLDHKNAVREADSIVRLTQSDFAPENLSNFETGTATARMFTMFQSYFNMQANLLGTEFQKVSQEMGLKKGAGRLFYVLATGFTMPAFLAELIVIALAGDLDDEDDDGYLDEITQIMLFSQIRIATAMVPFVGPFAQSGINQFNDKHYDDRISLSPVIRTIESSVRAPKSVYEAISQEGKSKKTAFKDSLTALSILTGTPFQVLNRPGGFLFDVAEDRTEPDGTLDFIRGLTSGRPSDQ